MIDALLSCVLFVKVLVLEYIKAELLTNVLFEAVLLLEYIKALALLLLCVVPGGLVRLVTRQNRPADSLSS